MFHKRDKVEITPGDPQFSVKYVGKIETFIPGGKGCTKVPVQKIWDNSCDERKMPHMAMLITQSEVKLMDVISKADFRYDIHRISYCSAEQGVHDKIFCWIYKDTKTKKLECHAVLCTSKESAQAMALVLSRAFQIAYKDWKHSKDKMARLKDSIKKQEITKNGMKYGTNKPDVQQNGATPRSHSKRVTPDVVAMETKHGVVDMEHGISDMNITKEEDSMSFTDNDTILDNDVEDTLSKDVKIQQFMNGDLVSNGR